MKRFLRRLAVAFVVFVVVVGILVAYDQRKSPGHPSAFTPADTSLHKRWLYFYPSREAESRGVIVFFGNDLAFWEPHQDLAWRFAGEGWSVVGVDLRRYLATLPDAEPARDSAFAASMPDLIARTRHALKGDGAPLILAGHSFGAELAFWVAEHRPPPRLVGVLALNPRGTGHLTIAPSDWMNREPSGPWSFSVINAAGRIDPRVRIALVRSGEDRYRVHDSAFVAAGGARLNRYVIPFAAHSLRTMLLAGPIIDRAVNFLADTSGRAQTGQP